MRGNGNRDRIIWKGSYVRFWDNYSCQSGDTLKDTAPVFGHLGNLLQTVIRRSCLPKELKEGSSWWQGRDRGLEPLDIESSLQKRIPSANTHISLLLGSVYLLRQLRLLFHNFFIKHLRNYPCYFFKCMGNKQNHSIHGRNVPLKL